MKRISAFLAAHASAAARGAVVWGLARLAERSTAAGLVGIALMVIGAKVAPAWRGDITTGVSLGLSVLAIVTKDAA